MVRGLLNENLSAILTVNLESLSENWVKRLAPTLVQHEPGEVCRHHQLHPFDWVRRLCCPHHIYWKRCCKVSHGDQQRLGAHTLDWEANTRQVEVAIQNFFARNLTRQESQIDF